jgi:putative DNA primase/helicase
VSGESLQNPETDKYRVANLYGKWLNAFPDLKDTPLQTNEVFNILTGNDAELTGEKKYQHDFRFKPTAKLLFSANKIPFAYSDNYAYYRRWILIEFPKTFEKDEIDDSILEKLTTTEEKSGFINRMLDGLK